MFESRNKLVQGLIDRGLLEYVRDGRGKIVLKTTVEGSRTVAVIENVGSLDRARRVRGLRMMRRVFGKEYRQFRPEYLKCICVVGRGRRTKP